MNPIFEYWNKIQSGEIIAGKWIKLLYEKITKGIQDGTYIYDDKKARRVIAFIETFCLHHEGPLGGQKIKLELWQKAMLSCIYGIIDPNTGLRQFVQIPVVIGRKQGKTLLLGGLSNYATFVDYEVGGQVYFLAPKLDQSAFVYKAFKYTVDHNPDFAALIKPKRNELYIEENNTTIKRLPFAEKRSDGMNPSWCCFDEFAAMPGHRSLMQWQVIVSGTGAREQPLIFGISSAGYEEGGLYDDLFARGTAWLTGASEENRICPFFYTIDDEDKWDDLEELHKSMPNLGISVSENFILDQIKIAKKNEAAKREFMTKFACVKQNSVASWLPSSLIEKACGEHLSFDDFRDTYAVCGLDLSAKVDLTAAVCLIEKNGKINALAHFWLPSKKLEEAMARDNLPYDIYIQRGLLSLSGESMIDYHDIFNWFVNLVQEYKILPLMIGYDSAMSTYIAPELKRIFEIDDVFQGDNLWPIMQTAEALLRDEKINIGDNDLLKIHLLQTGSKFNKLRNRGMPVKIQDNWHIDGTVAFLDALTVRDKWYSTYGEQWKNE